MGGDTPANTTSTTTTRTEPPSYIAPYTVELANRASSLSRRPYEAYQGEQVAPLTTSHQQGIDTVTQRALGGSPSLNAANQQAQKTLEGGFNYVASNPLAGVDNPYLNQIISQSNQDISRQFTNSTMPSTDATFARSGAFGGSAWQQANAENNRQLASELAKNTANLRYGDYLNQVDLAEQQANRSQAAFDSERGRQVGTIGAAQQLSNQPYTDAMQLLGVGDIQRDYQQTLNNQLYQNWLNEQNWPLQNLDVLANAIRTSMGGGGTTTQTATLPSINPTASMIGGGLAGAALGNSLSGGSGYGTAAGGALGAGLAGLLG